MLNLKLKTQSYFKLASNRNLLLLRSPVELHHRRLTNFFFFFWFPLHTFSIINHLWVSVCVMKFVVVSHLLRLQEAMGPHLQF